MWFALVTCMDVAALCRDDGGVRVCVLFLLATLIAQQRYFTYASDDDGGRCSLKPWQLDKEYVPDEETEPEDFELWLNDLSTVGHFGSARSRGVYVMSGLEGLNDENWWNTSELHNYDNVENVTASANLSSTAIEVANATTLVNLEAIRTESQPSANKYARENGTATSKYSSDSTTINEERPDEKISENQESADGTSDPGQSKGEKTVEKSESESPSEQAQPESQSEESTQSEGSQSKSSNDDDSSQSRTSAKSICMDPRGLVDDDSDEALYLGSDWTGTDTQKSKVRKLRRWIEADYKDVSAVSCPSMSTRLMHATDCAICTLCRLMWFGSVIQSWRIGLS